MITQQRSWSFFCLCLLATVVALDLFLMSCAAVPTADIDESESENGVEFSRDKTGRSTSDSSSGGRQKRWKDRCPIPGCKGQKGERGDYGPVGPQGYTGRRGPPGYCSASLCWKYIEKHMKGSSDPPQMGDPGIPGDPGPKGEKGNPGRDGIDGAKGEKGDQGRDGMDGAPGMKGANGNPGSKGVPGLQGPPGADGARGDRGLQGDPGQPGDDGAPGRKGVPGLKGEIGAPGIPGIPGRDGMNGNDGEKGQKGDSVPRIEVITRIESAPCTEDLQGVIRFDPVTKQLYFCDSIKWVCITPENCSGSPTCPSPYGQQNIGDQFYQVFVSNVTQDTQDAADIVIVIDESASMHTEQEWLLVMVPALEEALISTGVGDGAVHNRYCLVGFGSVGDRLEAHFLFVNDQPCFRAADFPSAQKQLIATGLHEDGYEAIQFALDNTPFRESPFIAKNILLVTDEGRTVIEEGQNITRESIEAQLKARDIVLNVIVFADYQLPNSTDEVVIGVDSRLTSYLLRPDGQFITSDDPVVITGAEGNTADVYVDLAISLGGASWSLRILRNSTLTSNTELQESFTSALVQVKIREIRSIIESCRKCTCVTGTTEGTAAVNCVVADDDRFCRCVVSNNGDPSTCTDGPDIFIPTENPEGERPSDGRIIIPDVPDSNGRITSIPRDPDFVILDAAIEN